MNNENIILKAEQLANEYPNDGITKLFLRTLQEEGRNSEETLSAANALIESKGN